MKSQIHGAKPKYIAMGLGQKQLGTSMLDSEIKVKHSPYTKLDSESLSFWTSGSLDAMMMSLDWTSPDLYQAPRQSIDRVDPADSRLRMWERRMRPCEKVRSTSTDEAGGLINLDVSQ